MQLARLYYERRGILNLEQVPGRLRSFWRIFAGSNPRAYIIGKGPSLDTIETVFDQINGPIFCLNESIRKVETIKHNFNVFVVQQDCDDRMGTKCVPTKDAVHFMSQYQIVDGLPWNGWPGNASPYNPKAVLYAACDFGEQDCELSAIMAMHLAKLMGCRAVTFCCFDSWVDSGSCEYAKVVEALGNKSGDLGEPGRHRSHRDYILKRAVELGFEWDTLHPKYERK